MSQEPEKKICTLRKTHHIFCVGSIFSGKKQRGNMCTQETLFCIWSLYLNCQENLFLHREINKESQLTSRGAINFSALIIGSLGWSNQRHKKELRTCWTINIRKMMRLQRVKRCSPRKFFLPGLPIITKNYFKIFTTTLN